MTIDGAVGELFFTTLQVLVVVFNLFYLLLALLVWRQTASISQQIETPTGKMLVAFSLFNLIMVSIVFIVSMIIVF